MTGAADVCGDLLRSVSRSFYLSLAILPRPLRQPISLAYLLARAADTVADTRLIPRDERLRHLETLRAAYIGDHVDVSPVTKACAPHQAYPAERRLLEQIDEILARVETLPATDRAQVRAVLPTVTSGMLFDLDHFPGEDPTHLGAVETLDELDHYTYLVAGSVGEFWTALHIAHRPRLRDWHPGPMAAAGIRFGKALQMTNILRDVPSDLRNGRCYLPARELAGVGIAPRDLLDPSRAARARPLLYRLIDLTLDHYQVAWRYTLAIPRLECRMRLACAWPLLIGLATLAKLAAHPEPLTPPPIKISRLAVRAILARSLLTIWSNRALGAEAERLGRRVRAVGAR